MAKLNRRELTRALLDDRGDLLVVAGLAVYRMVVALQVLAGLVVVFLLYRVALWMMRSDKLVLDRLKERVSRQPSDA